MSCCRERGRYVFIIRQQHMKRYDIIYIHIIYNNIKALL